MYGMGGATLCERLGLPTAWKKRTLRDGTVKRWLGAGVEAQRLIDRYDEMLPFVKKLSKLCEEAAEARGYIVTAGGRHCRFPKQKDGTYDWIFKALNRLIQGSSGDQMKTAMVHLDDAGIPIQLQVHDEVDGSLTPEQAEAGVEIMKNALPCNVPHRVSPEHGPSWGEIE